MVFQIFYQVQGGLDSFLSLLGCDSFFTVVENGVEVVKYPEWLANPQIVNWALVAASVWRYLGFNLILFYGVLQSIPQDQYEAARIEGATEWQQFRFITLPSIKMILGLQALLAFVGSLSIFHISLPRVQTVLVPSLWRPSVLHSSTMATVSHQQWRLSF